MNQRTLTAMYDTRGAAEAARDELVGLGVPSADVAIRGTETAGGGQAAGDDRGFWASLSDLFVPDEDRYTYAEGLRRGGYLLSVTVPEGLEDEAVAVLERSEAVDVDERSQSWRQSGWRGYEAAVPASASGAGATAVLREEASAGYAGEAPMASNLAGTSGGAAVGYGSTTAGRSVGEGEESLQVVEEQLRVGKREVGRGGVRVRSYVREIPVEEQVELRQERVTVERRPVERELAPGEAAAAFQERTIEAVERGEEAVVSKTARVVEEIGIRKDVERETETVRDTVRKQEVEIEDERGRGLGTETDTTLATDVDATDRVRASNRDPSTR